MEYNDSIVNHQQEVFEYLLKKKEELEKEGVEFWFDFDRLSPETKFEDLKEELSELDINLILQNQYLYYNGHQIEFYVYHDESLWIQINISTDSAQIKDDVWIDEVQKNNSIWKEYVESKSKFLTNANIYPDSFYRAAGFIVEFNSKSIRSNLDTVINVYLDFCNFAKLDQANNFIKEDFINSYNELQNFKQNFKRLSVSDILIKSFRGIENIEIRNIQESNQWIIFTGENAYGKTSILQAILSYLDFVEEIDKVEKKTPKVNNHTIEVVFNTGYKKSNRRLKDFVAAYGPHRLTVASEGFTNENPNKHIFPSGYNIPLQNIELQLSRWYYKKDAYPEFNEKYENVVRILKELLPNVSDIVVTKDDKVYYHETDKEGKPLKPVTFDKLASGAKGIVAFVGDLILRFFKSQPKVTNPSDFVGIVLIDELDLHLHPKWQIRLPGILSKLFPKLQFIASTHSPFPLMGAPENSIAYAVDRDETNGITVKQLSTNVKADVEKADISSLLLHFFNNAPIVSENTRQRTERFQELKLKKKLSKAEKAELAEIDNSLKETTIYTNIHDIRYLKFLEVLKKLGIEEAAKIPNEEIPEEALTILREEFAKYYPQ